MLLEILEDRIAPANSITVIAGGSATIPAGASDFNDTGTYTIAPSAFSGVAGAQIVLESNGPIDIVNNLPAFPDGQGLDVLAGREIVIQANITLSNALMFFHANDENAVQAQRPAGDAVLAIENNSQISDVGTGEIEFVGGIGDSTGANTHPTCPVLVAGTNADPTNVTGGTNGIVILGASNTSNGGDAVLIEGATINGNGGNVAVTGGLGSTPGNGIHLRTTAVIQTGGSGTVTLNGTGTGLGVLISASTVSTADGLLSITGTASASNNTNSMGINLSSATVEATGNGGVTLNGTGNPNGTNGVGVGLFSSAVAVNNGSLSIVGIGQGAAGNNVGVDAEASTVEATGSGTISIQGTAPAGQAGIDFSGTAYGLGSGALATNSGFIQVQANEINFGAANSVSSTGTAELLFVPLNDVPIVLGGNNVTGSLVFTDTDLAAIASGFGLIDIGFSAGTVTGGITTANNLTFNSNVLIQTPIPGGSGTIAISKTIAVGAHNLTVQGGGPVAISSGGLVSAAGGSITVTGTATATDPVGLSIANSGTTINANGGNITLTGTGANQGGGGTAFGVVVANGATVQTTDAGTITMVGAGGTTTSPAIGVLIAGAATSISTGDGILSIQGNATGTGTGMAGVEFQGGVVQTTGQGTLSLSGTGSANGTKSVGVLLQAGATLSVGNGTMLVTGTGRGSASTNLGIDVEGSTIQSTGSGEIEVTGANSLPANPSAIDFTGTLFGGGSGTLTTNTGRAFLIGDLINLGAANSVSSTGAAELTFVSAGDFPMILGGNNVTGSLVFTDADRAAIKDSSFGLIDLGHDVGNDASGITTASNLTPFNTNVLIETSLTGTGPITITNTISVGAHNLTVQAGGPVAINSGGVLLSGAGGSISATGTGTAAGAVGVAVNAGIINAGGGNISLTGTGVNQTGSNPSAGLDVNSGATVQTTGKGTITIVGNGGTTTSPAFGLLIASGANISTVDGNLSIQGAATGTTCAGIIVTTSAMVQATGKGAVTLTGTGSANGTFSPGVFLLNGATVSVANGPLSITGTGQGSATTNLGVDVEGATVKATGSGTITILGTAPANAAGIDFTGTSAGGGSGTLTTNTGRVFLIGDLINLGAANSVSSTGAAELTFLSDGDFPMILGGNNVTGSLVFTDSDRAAIKDSSFGLIDLGHDVGSDTSGITTASNLTPFNTNVLIETSLTGSGPITISNTIDVGAHTLTIRAGAAITQASGGLLKANNLALQDNTGIATGATPLLTQASHLVAQTANSGGVFVSNTGPLTIGFTGDSIQGVQVKAGSGAITLTNTGPLSITTNGENLGTTGGNITLTGTGAAANATGISVTGDTINANGGNISLTGTGTGAAANTYGIDLEGGSVVATAGSGTIAVTASSPAGASNEGLRIAGSSRMTAGGGDASKALGLAAGSTIVVALDPTRATATGYEFVHVNGDVTLGGSTLQATSTGTLPAGGSYTVVNPQNGSSNNDGVFNGIAEGSTTTINGTLYAATYVGTDGNDMLLQATQAPAFTSTNSATFTVGTAGTFTVKASGFPTPTLSESNADTLPSGVTFNAATGALAGTPAAGSGGTYTLHFTAQNGIGTNATQTFTLTVNQAPAITSGNATTFTVGTAGSFTVTTTGFPLPALSETGDTLPSGVTFKDNGNGTATLAGTASAAGSFTIAIKAANAVGANATQTFTLTVSSANSAPTINSANNATFTVGTAGSFTVTTGGFPLPALSETGNTLPSAVTFKDNGNGTATLGGTAAASGTFVITIKAANGISPDATQTFTLTVNPANAAPAVTSANNATFTVGTSGSLTVTTTGFPVPALSETGNTLPSGVTFKDNGNGTATLGGTASASGTFAITIKAANGVAPDASQTFTLTVNPANAAPAITSANNATFSVGTAGSLTVTTTGFPVPALSETGNTLPNGVTFKDNGNGTATLAGTASASGTFAITIKAANGIAPDASQTFTLTVNPANAAPAITSGNNTSFGVGSAGSFTVTTTGFPLPALSESGDTLPNGVTFKDNGNGTATLAGTAAAAGSYTIAIKAANGISPDANQTFTLTVSAANTAPAITSANKATFTVGTSGSFTVTTTGLPTPTLSETGDTLPAGVTFKDNGNGTATLSGNPAASGTFVIAIKAANGVAPDASQTFTLTVNPANAAPAITGANNTTFTAGTAGSFTVASTGFPLPALSESGDTLPSGVTFKDNGNGTATLAGTAAAAGSFTIAIKAANGILPNATQTFTLTVSAANTSPTITSANNATFNVGTAGSFTVTTTGAPTAAITETGDTLPTGVTFKDNGNGTATLTGTAGATGSFTIAIKAANGFLPNAVQTFTLTVNPANAAPAITSANNTSFTVGTAGSFTVTTTGSPTAALSETGATLPSGVTFKDNGNGTATLAGAAAASGTIVITITAANGIAPNATQTFTLTVNSPQPPTITTATLPTYVTQGQAYNATIATTGGVAPIAFSLSAGALPAGLTLAPSTGVISGTPTAFGTATFTVQAQGASGAPATQAYTVVILPPEFAYDPVAKTLVITLVPSLPSFQYTQVTTATGNSSSSVYTFTLSGSSAPTISQPFTDTLLTTAPGAGASVTVIGQGLVGTAILITNDTYLDPTGQKQETPERMSLGSLTDAGVGTISKFVGNNLGNPSYSFLAMKNFPLSYAYAGRNDGTIMLQGTEGTGKVGFVTAGYYSYIAAAVTGLYAHFGEGTPNVVGTSAGNAADFAYHYTSSAPSTVSTITSVYTVNGIASSSMAGRQTNPEDGGAIDTFNNLANGFVLNTAVSYTGNSIAHINDSPLSDTYVAQATDPLGLGSIGGVGGFSYMYEGAFPAFGEFDVAYGFGTYFATATNGGHDIDYPGAPLNNVFSGGWIQSFS